MPTKKKVESEPPSIIEEVVSALSGNCGHVNKQHYGTKGKLEDLACALPMGHAGDHAAPYVKLVGEPVTDEKGRVTKTNYSEEPAKATWGDAAGTPASQIRPGEIEAMSLLQKDLVMQIMAKNPNIKVEEATAQAKASPEWTAARS